MERTVRPAFQNVGAGLVELRIQTAESIVDGCSTEHAYTLALTLLQLEPLSLYDDAQTLNEEDATQQGKHQFLMDDDGTHSNDATNGQ